MYINEILFMRDQSAVRIDDDDNNDDNDEIKRNILNMMT